MAVRDYKADDLNQMLIVWNQIVEDGNAFPQEELLTLDTVNDFFTSQTRVRVLEESDEIIGLYILHPNNVGRCGHISNSSYAVRRDKRGCGAGEALVLDSLRTAKEEGFKILQFNAVVEDNIPARKLYEKLGFISLGTIPNGFRLNNGTYKNICPYYYDLKEVE